MKEPTPSTSALVPIPGTSADALKQPESKAELAVTSGSDEEGVGRPTTSQSRPGTPTIWQKFEILGNQYSKSGGQKGTPLKRAQTKPMILDRVSSSDSLESVIRQREAEGINSLGQPLPHVEEPETGSLFSGVATGAITAATSTAASAIHSIKSAASSVADRAANVTDTVSNVATSAVSSVTSATGAVAGAISNAAGSAVTSVANVTEAAADAVVGKARMVTDAVTDTAKVTAYTNSENQGQHYEF